VLSSETLGVLANVLVDVVVDDRYRLVIDTSGILKKVNRGSGL
jgi:hypothetical protein